jgi:hypothetical protein
VYFAALENEGSVNLLELKISGIEILGDGG